MILIEFKVYLLMTILIVYDLVEQVELAISSTPVPSVIAKSVEHELLAICVLKLLFKHHILSSTHFIA